MIKELMRISGKSPNSIFSLTRDSLNCFSCSEVFIIHYFENRPCTLQSNGTNDEYMPKSARWSCVPNFYIRYTSSSDKILSVRNIEYVWQGMLRRSCNQDRQFPKPNPNPPGLPTTDEKNNERKIHVVIRIYCKFETIAFTARDISIMVFR